MCTNGCITTLPFKHVNWNFSISDTISNRLLNICLMSNLFDFSLYFFITTIGVCMDKGTTSLLRNVVLH